jgi:hypothetical protein
MKRPELTIAPVAMQKTWNSESSLFIDMEHQFETSAKPTYINIIFSRRFACNLQVYCSTLMHTLQLFLKFSYILNKGCAFKKSAFKTRQGKGIEIGRK